MEPTKFQKLVNNPLLMKAYLLKSLPMAFIAGIKVKSLTNGQATTTIRFSWITQNPFRSMYFACQAMAAEMSTALLVLNEIYDSKPSVSMLIVKNESIFHKKAVGKITFTCNDGNHISEIIAQTKRTGEGVTTDLRSIGTDEAGDKVAEFVFTWSLKAKTV